MQATATAEGLHFTNL